MLKQQGYLTLPTEILDLLDAEAIKILQSIHLRIVPKVYNWLLEEDKLYRQRRVDALLQYPILLVSFVCPTSNECYPEDLEKRKHISETMVIIQQVSQRIDDGEPVEIILANVFNVSANTLAEIKGKTFKDITHENNPKLFGQFQDDIEIYCQIATFL